MEELITIILPQNDVGQILDGLHERMNVWKTTEEYLRFDSTLKDCIIEECSDPDEAEKFFFTNVIWVKLN